MDNWNSISDEEKRWNLGTVNLIVLDSSILIILGHFSALNILERYFGFNLSFAWAEIDYKNDLSFDVAI